MKILKNNFNYIKRKRNNSKTSIKLGKNKIFNDFLLKKEIKNFTNNKKNIIKEKNIMIHLLSQTFTLIKDILILIIQMIER